MNEPVYISVDLFWLHNNIHTYYIRAAHGTKSISTPEVHPTEPNQLEADIKKVVELLTKDKS